MGVRQTVEMEEVEQGIGIVEVELNIEMVLVGQGVGQVEVELGTEEVVLGQGLMVEVQPGIDEGDVKLVVVDVAVKHVVEMVVE